MSSTTTTAVKGTANAGVHPIPFNPKAASQLHVLDEEIQLYSDILSPFRYQVSQVTNLDLANTVVT